MTRTAAHAIASAREILNDEDGGSVGENYRTKDSTLLGFALDALNAVRNARPDLFLGNWGDLTLATSGTSLPLADQFFQPIVFYMVGRAEMKDDEAASSGRAKLMSDLLQGFLR